MKNEQRLKTRRGKIAAVMNEQGAGALVVAKPANVTYATGFLGDDSWALLTRRTTYLITDSRYTAQAKAECPGCKVIERTEPMAKAVAGVLNRLRAGNCPVVESSVSVAALAALRKNVKGRIKAVSNIVESVRSVKEPAEIAVIKAGAKICVEALRKVRRYFKPGVTENELSGRLDFEIRRLGAKNAFDTIVAFGANASQPHHITGKTRLKKRDMILIDFGAKCRGYCCDLTRCFVIGEPTQLYRKAYEAVQQARDAAIAKVKAGAEATEVDKAARQVIRKYRLPVFGHGLGHGLGLEVHEQPVVSDKAKGRLEAGNVITVEPAVYIPGKLGIRIEDDVVVTKTGYRILSNMCLVTSL